MSDTYVKKSNLREFVNTLLFEKEAVHGNRKTDVAYGLYDRPLVNQPGGVSAPADDFESTLPDEVPVSPGEQMATQLATDRPPIEDEEFIPGNPDELGRAADVIAKQVPQDQIEKFYRALHKLLDQTVEMHNEPDTAGPTADAAEASAPPPVEPKGKKKETTEESLRRRIRGVIQEIQNPTDDEGYDEYRYGTHEVEPEIEDEPPAPESPSGMGLEDIAAVTGHSGPSGARQEIERILSRSEYLGDKMSDADLATLRTAAVGEFIDALRAGDYIDDDDVVELQQAPGEVEALDSFRFFFTQAFVLPAFNELTRAAKKRVKDGISKMGLPEKMNQAILNQALGDTPRSMGKLTKKLYSVSAAENLPPEQVEKMKTSMLSGFENLKKLAETGEGLMDAAQARWSRTGDSEKQKVMQQALQSTADYRKDFENLGVTPE